MTIIFAVKAKEIKGGYSYWAKTDKGDVPLRKKATRLYENAFYYGKQAVASGSNGLAAHFLYGKKPGLVKYFGRPVMTFKIELVGDCDKTNLTELAAFGL